MFFYASIVFWSPYFVVGLNNEYALFDTFILGFDELGILDILNIIQDWQIKQNPVLFYCEVIKFLLFLLFERLVAHEPT